MFGQQASNVDSVRPARGLVLASSSPYRRALLERLACPFEWQAPEIDESRRPGESAMDLVRRLALAKARALAGNYPTALIVGSDQLAVVNGHPLGKPGSAERAFEQLSMASGQRVEFLTSVCVLDCAREHYELQVVTTNVRFRDLNERQIRNYIDREHPLDCAGSFKCEGLGIALFESMTSDDPSALIGLPLIALVGMLSRAGFDILAESP